MKLSNRMNSIINFLETCGTIADIGTDHGFIPLEIINRGLAKKVIATDISANSLKKTEELVAEYGLEDSIETRVGDGLTVIGENEVDTIIIAGMGGILISEIIGGFIELAKNTKLILQPMTAEAELKRYLVNNNFRIIDEYLCLDGKKFYQTIYVEYGESKKDYDIYISPFWKKDSIYYNYLKNMVGKYKIIVNGLKISDKDGRLEENEKLLKIYEEALYEG
ncbi:MAG: SAM-dependent methyltransferase [Tissierellia bacterium]|nr:SAM-dependent methyltransferase [Tissierellia bacterium]